MREAPHLTNTMVRCYVPPQVLEAGPGDSGPLRFVTRIAVVPYLRDTETHVLKK
jgi:hypothetical protein